MGVINSGYLTQEMLIIYLIGALLVALYAGSWYKSYLIRHDKYERKKHMRFRGWLFVFLVVLIFVLFIANHAIGVSDCSYPNYCGG